MCPPGCMDVTLRVYLVDHIDVTVQRLAGNGRFLLLIVQVLNSVVKFTERADVSQMPT